MGLARATCVALLGIEGHLVEVEADVTGGLPATVLIGLPDATLQEARDRIRAAFHNSELAWPAGRLTVALSPAALPKRGSTYDLAIAVAIVAAGGLVPQDALDGVVLLGELALDGRVRPVPGVLPAVFGAARAGVARVVVPSANAAEAALVPGVSVVGVPDLAAVVAYLQGESVPALPPAVGAGPVAELDRPDVDLADVVGQERARRALEVAAAGGHHLMLVGPPGSGKTMLAERLPTLLPRLEAEHALEVSAIHSVAGILPADAPLVTVPPFRSPHHSVSRPALVGGGTGLARPGELSLAHRGVLFLDEAPEFPAGHLDALRQPLEKGSVTIARAQGAATYPARATLVLAANPCPCSRPGAKDRDCTCPHTVRQRYLGRISGPLRDRLDVRLVVEGVAVDDLDGRAPEGSAVVRERVAEARTRMRHRLAGTPWTTNGEVPGRELRRRWPLPPDAVAPATAALARGELSARGLDRVVRVAWTLADMAGATQPKRHHVSEAVALRRGNRDG